MTVTTTLYTQNDHGVSEVILGR